jgi:hypothetical protein
MINIKISQPKDGYMGETYVFCPGCGKITIFYSVSPPICSHCTLSFPDIRSLKLKINYRTNWHKGVYNVKTT